MPKRKTLTSKIPQGLLTKLLEITPCILSLFYSSLNI